MPDPAGAGRKPGRPQHRKWPVSTVNTWIAGGLGFLGAVIAALITILGGSPPVVHVTFGGTRPATPPASQTAASGAGATVAPRVVFRDDFCTAAGGWTLGPTRAGGHYGRCALRIYANGNDVESSEPANARRFPQDITIGVTARRVLGSAAGDELGISCRAGSEGYAFIVQASLVSIYRYSSTTGIIGRQPLAQAPARIDMNAGNRLQARCATSPDGAADLGLWVDHRELTQATDASDPLTGGTVGLFAATTPGTTTPTEAKFTNFMVTGS
jgi:hypothetical protein